MKKLTLIVLLINIPLLGQTSLSEFSVSGNLKVYFGSESISPKFASIVLLPNNHITEIDSLGNYKFDNLKSGTYKIMVIDYNPNPKKFRFEIDSSSISDFNLIVDANCEVSKEIAEQDIQNDKPRLLLISGIAPYVSFEDNKFAKKYGIIFQDFGDTPPAENCVKQYNSTVFDFLDKKFGKKWREEVRDDVIGLK
ncbi:FEKKY domain-containing protein [Marixanthomonas spongiae]|uniref:Carboxypeptidase regulatory-like domain-containing protein n=1 Tax=Marixanthomonas spongiae TaxID=2174845 RepID=A0A2U0I8F4_9FLAO|nr:hypothetical protein [Marixanthomonas spongiae]PVW17381.1 hypothetical protein DDV96_02430 [Marixanthomonas spongiae]